MTLHFHSYRPTPGGRMSGRRSRRSVILMGCDRLKERLTTHRKPNKPALGPTWRQPGRSGATLMIDKPVVAATSLAAQYGVRAETIRRALTHISDGGASGPLGTRLDLLTSEVEP